MFSHTNRFAQQNSTTLSQDLKITTMTPKNHLHQVKPKEENNELIDQVDDYEFNPTHYTISQPAEKYTKSQLVNKHPLQLIAEESRHTTNVVGQLEKNQIALTNLPSGFTPEEAIALCKESVPGLEVFKHRTVSSLNIKNKQNSFIILDLAGERQVVDLTKKMRHVWVGDKLIKLRYYKDAKKEHFNQRTLVLRGIPTSFQASDIIELFDDSGAIAAIELPTKSVALEATAKGEFVHNKEYEMKEERQRRYAQKIIDENLRMDEEYQNMLINKFGEQGAQKLLSQEFNDKQKGKDKYDLLDVEKINSVIRGITLLQSEGVQITNSKELIRELRHQLDLENGEHQDARGASVPRDGVKISQEETLTQHSDNIKQIVEYLARNQDNLNTQQQQYINKWAQSSNPVQEILQTSREEVGFAYDTLLSLLDLRDQLIQDRLVELVKHFGDKERVLIEQTNDKLENMPKVYDFAHKYRFKVEEVLSLQEQINNINQRKHLTDEERFIGVLFRRLNPFTEYNFTDDQIAQSQSTTLDGFDWKQVDLPDPRMTPSLAQMLYRNHKGFLPRVKNEIDQIVKEVRDRMELPFDELYHKERNLVTAVVEAEKAIRRKEETFRLSILDGKKYDESATNFMGEPVVPKSHEQNFHNKQQKKADKLLQEKLRMKDQDASSYKYQSSLENKYEKLVEDGLMTQDEFEKAKAYAKELDQENLGYCFITFSHTDEAKVLLFESKFTFIDYNQIKFNLKQNMDHGDFDQQYTMDQIKNDASMVDEIKELRQARKDLRDFEANIDAHMPKARKLKEFRDFARDIIEDKPHLQRKEKMSRRTKQEELEVDDKIRKLQKENPTVDMTPLFDSDRADAARKEMHKKQFASYKAFTFLKNGVKKAEDSANAAAYNLSQKKLDENDPYNFPALNVSVNTILSSEIDLPRALDQGEVIDKPGRRFSYTDQEFLEAYLGKDFRRMPDLNNDDSLIMEFQEDLKYKYKIDDYLKMPEIEERKQRIQDLKIDFLYDSDGNVNDPKIRELVSQALYDQQKIQFKDIPHPEDNNRSYIKDLKKIQDQIDQKEDGETIHIPTLARKHRDLVKEYGLNGPKGDWFQKVMKKVNPDYVVHVNKKVKARRDAYNNSKFESDYRDDQEGHKRHTLNPEQLRANNEYMYEMEHAKRTGKELKYEEHQKLGQFADHNKAKVEDIYKAMARDSVIAQEPVYGGEHYRNQATGVADDYDLDEELSKMTSRTRASPQGLRQFSSDYDQDSDLSEREDDDIYAHYKKQMEKAQMAQQEKAMDENEIAHEYIRLTKDLEQQVPTSFNDYHQSNLRGDSPFQNQANSDEAFDFKLGEDDYQEIERDNELYIRELHGRFMGEKLTPRQFELISGTHFVQKDGKNQIEYGSRFDREQYLLNRDWVRLNEEKVERVRRQKVLSGEWTEQESHEKIRKTVTEFYNKQPTTKQRKLDQQDHIDAIDFYKTMDNPGRLYEKEYHFDETLGLSLKDHVEELKQTFPHLKVQTRRDRDGFAIVKTLYKPNYKYDLDQITKMDNNEVKRISNECQEAMLELLFPEGVEKHFNNVMQNGQQEQNNNPYDLDARTKEALDILIKKRMNGEIDRVEFKEHLSAWKDNVTFDETKKFSLAEVKAQMESGMDNAMEQIKQDRRLLQYELSTQLKNRENAHRNFTKRKHQDFVKPRMSEKNLFNIQTMKLDDVTNDMEAQLPSEEKQQEEDFDREAYEKIRAEIKQRRDAKESILRQGYPELKPYMRL